MSTCPSAGLVLMHTLAEHARAQTPAPPSAKSAHGQRAYLVLYASVFQGHFLATGFSEKTEKSSKPSERRVRLNAHFARARGVRKPLRSPVQKRRPGRP